MIHIAVYDDDSANMKKLDSVFVYHTVTRNAKYDVSWFVGSAGFMKIEKYAADLHIAFVSVSAKNNREFCEKLCKKNPDCRICYYSTDCFSMTDISNPIWFIDEAAYEPNEKLFAADRIDSMFNEFRYFGNFLIFDTRQFLYMVPVENIEYLQSDLKYVNIVCRDGSSISLYKKLDEVELSLPNVFMRIHKSYIVNKTYIDKIDKAKRIVVLNDGSELPISNSQYAKVLEELVPKI